MNQPHSKSISGNNLFDRRGKNELTLPCTSNSVFFLTGCATVTGSAGAPLVHLLPARFRIHSDAALPYFPTLPVRPQLSIPEPVSDSIRLQISVLFSGLNKVTHVNNLYDSSRVVTCNRLKVILSHLPRVGPQ